MQLFCIDIHTNQLRFILLKFILLYFSTTIYAYPTGEPIQLVGTEIAFPKVVTKEIPPLNFVNDPTSNVKKLDVDGGLSSSYVFSMVEDSLSNIWLATQTGGIDCYDGKNITNYQFEDGDNAIYNLIFDEKGYLWFQKMKSGICRFDGKTFVCYDQFQEISKRFANSIGKDNNGNLWFNTSENGCIVIDPNQLNFSHITTKEGLHSDLNNHLINTLSGQTYVYNVEGIQELFSNNKIGNSLFENDSIFDGKYLEYATIDRQGDFWMIWDGQLVHYNGHDFKTYSYDKDNILKSLFIDSYNNIWTTNNRRELLQFKDGNFIPFSTKNTLKNAHIIFFFEDSFHNFWVSSFGNGIYKIDNQMFTHYGINDGIKQTDGIYPRFIDETLFVCATSRYILEFNKELNKFQVNNELTIPKGQVIDIFKDSQNNIWYGTPFHGLVRKNDKGFTYFYNIKDTLSGYANFITESPDGTIWYSNGRKGITQVLGDSLHHKTEKDGILEDFYLEIYFDKKGQMWLGSYTFGLIKYSCDESIFISQDKLQKAHHVSNIQEDKWGNLWIASSLGLLRYHNNQLSHYTVKDGIPHNSVIDILQDKKQQIWIGTEKGISKVYYNPETQDVNFNHFGIKEGFRGNDTGAEAAVLDTEGNIWWGTGKMLTKYNPKKDFIQHHQPKIQLKDIRLFFEKVDWQAVLQNEDSTKIKMSSIATWNLLPKNLQLPSKRNHLTFDFIATNWSAPQKLKYQFKLKGLEDNWSPLTQETKAVYSNIPPGEYTFQVKAVNEANLWSHTLEYPFQIMPAFWQTIWFRALVLLAIIASILSFIRWRTHSLKQRQKELEQMVKERTEAVEQSYNEVIKLNAEIFAQKQDIEKQQQQIQIITNNVPAGIAYINKDQKFVFANKTLIKWLTKIKNVNSIGKKDIIDQHLSKVLVPDHYQSEIHRYEKVLSGELVTFERISNQGDFIHRCTYIPDFNKFKEVNGFFVLLEDISQLKQIQEQLVHANHELKQFTSIASHDMKEPIRMISSFSSLLQRRYANELDENGQEYIQFIQGAANRMAVLLDDLLDYARAGINNKAIEEVDLNLVVRNVNNNLRLKIQETNTEITSDELPMVKAHFTTMNQVFQNLIANGIKFQPQQLVAESHIPSISHSPNPSVPASLHSSNPQIEIKCQTFNTHYQISISDNGIGMAPENQLKIFDVFKRLHSKTEYEGTGIGLATCKKIIEKYGGKIWVESKEGEGSCFHFTIPK